MTYKQALDIFETVVNNTGFTPSIHGPDERKPDALDKSKGFRIELSTKGLIGGIKIIDGVAMAGLVKIVNDTVPGGVANFSFFNQKLMIR